MLLYVHRNRSFIRNGEPRASTSTFTQLLNSETRAGSVSTLSFSEAKQWRVKCCLSFRLSHTTENKPGSKAPRLSPLQRLWGLLRDCPKRYYSVSKSRPVSRQDRHHSAATDRSVAGRGIGVGWDGEMEGELGGGGGGWNGEWRDPIHNLHLSLPNVVPFIS